MNEHDKTEIVLSKHTLQHWQRRDQELVQWVKQPKLRRRKKQIVVLGNEHIDAEMVGVLSLLRRLHITTEYSCAGVSVLDEPEDHSLYAYVTLLYSKQAEQFVELAMKLMKHRILVTFEPERNRYDLSSFYIGHNRSFCMLLEHCAKAFMELEKRKST